MNRLDQLARVSVQVFWASLFAALGAATQSYLDRPSVDRPPGAHLIDDNVDRSGAIFFARDNNTAVFTVADGEWAYTAGDDWTDDASPDYGSLTDVQPGWINAVHTPNYIRIEAPETIAFVRDDGTIEYTPGYDCEDALRSIANRP